MYTTIMDVYTTTAMDVCIIRHAYIYIVVAAAFLLCSSSAMDHASVEFLHLTTKIHITCVQIKFNSI